MNRQFDIGDRVICSASGVIGDVIKFYTPTAPVEQTMVLTDDGCKYYAPTSTWSKYIIGIDIANDYPIPDVTIENPKMQKRHIAYVEKFAQNHGLSMEAALNQPMVKAHAVFCANSHPDIFSNYMREGC